MYRKNQLLGCAAIAFGLGLLVGKCVDSVLLCNVIGIAVIVLGLGCFRRK